MNPVPDQLGGIKKGEALKLPPVSHRLLVDGSTPLINLLAIHPVLFLLFIFLIVAVFIVSLNEHEACQKIKAFINSELRIFL